MHVFSYRLYPGRNVVVRVAAEDDLSGARDAILAAGLHWPHGVLPESAASVKAVVAVRRVRPRAPLELVAALGAAKEL